MIDKGDNQFVFMQPEPREVMRIRRLPDGQLEVTIYGDLHQAARRFWDIVEDMATSQEDIIVMA